MLFEPKCSIRKCIYYTGIIQPDGTEMTEVNVCRAFPEGIPNEIAYGDDPHDFVRSDQVGEYVYTGSLDKAKEILSI